MKVKEITLVALFASLTAIGAYLEIPISPVPITLQVLFVFLSGAILGRKLGAVSQLTYFGLGVLGLPIFAGGKGGVGVFLGPTGGYLIGFVFAAYIIGFVAEKTFLQKLEKLEF